MTTSINIVIGPLGLAGLSRREVEGNRFKQVERESEARTRLKIIEARKTPSGPGRQVGVVGATSPDANKGKVNFLRLQPAAFRRSGGVVTLEAGFVPIDDFMSTAYVRATRTRLSSDGPVATSQAEVTFTYFTQFPGPGDSFGYGATFYGVLEEFSPESACLAAIVVTDSTVFGGTYEPEPPVWELGSYNTRIITLQSVGLIYSGGRWTPGITSGISSGLAPVTIGSFDQPNPANPAGNPSNSAPDWTGLPVEVPAGTWTSAA